MGNDFSRPEGMGIVSASLSCIVPLHNLYDFRWWKMNFSKGSRRKKRRRSGTTLQKALKRTTTSLCSAGR